MSAQPRRGTFGKTGQPSMGRRYRVMTFSGEAEVVVIYKAWGAGGSSNCVEVGVEYLDDGHREQIPWPAGATAFIDHPDFDPLPTNQEKAQVSPPSHTASTSSSSSSPQHSPQGG